MTPTQWKLDVGALPAQPCLLPSLGTAFRRGLADLVALTAARIAVLLTPLPQFATGPRAGRGVVVCLAVATMLVVVLPRWMKGSTIGVIRVLDALTQAAQEA